MKLIRTGWTFGIVLILVVGAAVPIGLGVEGAANQSQSMQLQTLIQVAISSRNYAITIVDLAQSNGLSVVSSESLLTSGNDSLAVALADLSSNTNLTGGIREAEVAMSYYTNASTSASLSLQSSKTNAFLQIASDLDSIISLNSTATQFSSIISLTCANTPTNSSYISQFQKDCVSGGSYIQFAATDLEQASLLVSASETTQTTSGISEAENLIAEANGNISLAATVISQLSPFSYAERAQQYIEGPLASSLSTANSTVSAQISLASSFSSDLASYQGFSGAQVSAINSVKSGASSLSSSVSSSSSAIDAVSSSCASEQTTLSLASTDLAIPSSLNAVQSLLQSYVSGVQSAITTAASSVNTLQAEDGSFSQTSLSSLSSYSVVFQSDYSAVVSNNQAVHAAFVSLFTEIATLEIGFPALDTLLANWESPITSDSNAVVSQGTTLASNYQSAITGLTSLQTALSSFQSTTSSSTTGIEVSSTLVASISSIYSSEEAYLNSTALAELQSSLASIQLASQLSVSFVASAQSLLSVSVSALVSSVQSLSSSGSSLETQATSTLLVMTTASTFLSSDLQIRSEALTTANSDIAAALTMFEDLQVSQGASFLAQASVNLQIASEAG